MHRRHGLLGLRSGSPPGLRGAVAVVAAIRAIVAVAAISAITWLATPFDTATASPQAFHLVEINKLLVGYNGDMAIQAVELKLINPGENFVSGTSIAVYDSVGAFQGNLGTFAGNVANGAAGDRILCATAAFRDAFTITPDLLITAGIPMVTGQVAFEKVGCRINALPYGNVLTPLTSPTAAPALPPHGATVLERITDNGTLASCPQAENAAAKFQLKGGGGSSRIVFQNNARDTAQVWTTITSVEPGPGPAPPAAPALRASPNPFTAATTIRLPDEAATVSMYDVSGRLVRTWGSFAYASSGAVGPHSVAWDGRDGEGRPQPSGLYFMEARTRSGIARGRVLLLR